MIPMPGDRPGRAVIAGMRAPRDDPQRDIVLAALARFGSVALENASLHSQPPRDDRRPRAVRTKKLRHVLLVHETLTADVIGGYGIQAVADSLAGSSMREVARDWDRSATCSRARPSSGSSVEPPDGEPSARTITRGGPGGHIAAAPAAVQDEILAWLVARFETSPGQVERAAIEYGALLVAIELLRERTALEVEHRLRGGFLDELFSGEFVEDLLVKQGAAFGLDLTQALARDLPDRAAEGELGPVNVHLLYCRRHRLRRARGRGRRLVAVEGNSRSC